MVVAACSPSGGTPEGFCRRFNDLTADIAQGEHIDLAERVDGLGDPGGALSHHRAGLAVAVRNDDPTRVEQELAALNARCS